jgi:hypothetical protein
MERAAGLRGPRTNEHTNLLIRRFGFPFLSRTGPGPKFTETALN